MDDDEYRKLTIPELTDEDEVLTWWKKITTSEPNEKEHDDLPDAV